MGLRLGHSARLALRERSGLLSGPINQPLNLCFCSPSHRESNPIHRHQLVLWQVVASIPRLTVKHDIHTVAIINPVDDRNRSIHGGCAFLFVAILDVLLNSSIREEIKTAAVEKVDERRRRKANCTAFLFLLTLVVANNSAHPLSDRQLWLLAGDDRICFWLIAVELLFVMAAEELN